MTPRHKVLLLGSLYLAQGLPFGFFTQALPVLLRERGMSLGGIGLTALLFLPWALKFLWAPWVDRRHDPRLGRRRSWLLPLQVATVLGMLAIGAAGVAQPLALLLAGILVINLLAATQDIATDGLAVDLLAPAERGLGNGIQVAAYRLGMIAGGGLILVVFDALGWTGSFALMAAMLVAASIPIWRFDEVRTLPAAPAPTPGSSMTAALLRFVSRPGAWAWLGAIMLYKVGGAFGGAMVRPMLVDLGLELGDIGALLGIVGFLAGFAGALLGGLLVTRLGRTRALVAFGLTDAAANALYVLPAVIPVGTAGLGLITGVEHLVGGMATAALFTAMMDVCDADHGATDYTVQASAVVIATGLASTPSGFVASALGYANHFWLSAGLCLVGVAAIARARRPRPDVDTPGTSA